MAEVRLSVLIPIEALKVSAVRSGSRERLVIGKRRASRRMRGKLRKKISVKVCGRTNDVRIATLFVQTNKCTACLMEPVVCGVGVQHRG